MRYYIAVDNKTQGPYEVSELLARDITANTLVWNESMSGWLPAGQVPEIAQKLNGGQNTPPPPPPFVYTQTRNENKADASRKVLMYECPKTWLVQSILCTIFCCLPLGIVGIVMASQVESLWREGRYDEAVSKSNQAKTFVLLSFFIGLGTMLITGFLQFATIATIFSTI